MKSPDASPDMLEEIAALSRPRLSGTDGESRTLDYLESRLRERGIAVKREPFEFSILPIMVGFPLAPVIVTGLVVAASWLVLKQPWISAGLSAVSLAFIPVASRWSSLAEKLFDLPVRRRSANLVADLPGGKAEKTIIFTAHYDSKSQTLPIGLRIAGSLLSVPLAAMIALAILTMGVSLIILNAPGIAPLWMENAAYGLWIAAWVPFAAAVILLFNGTRNKSPGALDNASGCAVLLELARRFAENPPKNMNVRLIFTGAEEYGLAGAVRYAQAHAEELGPDNTLVLNVDSVGCGKKIGIVDRYGIPPVRTSRNLYKALAGSVPNCKRLYLPIGVGLDMFPFALRGCDSVSITSATLRTLFLIHTKKDAPANLDPTALDRAVKLCLAAATHL